MNFCIQAQIPTVLLTIMISLVIGIQFGESFAQLSQNSPSGMPYYTEQPYAGYSFGPSVLNAEYTNPTLGIRLLIPDNLQISEESYNNAILTSPDPFFGVAISTSPAVGINLDQQQADFYNNSPNPMLGSIIDTKSSLLSNYPAYTLIWYNPQQQTYALTIHSIINDVGYDLQFFAYENNFMSLVPLFEQIQSTFQIF